MNAYSADHTVKEAMADYFKKFDLGEDGGLNKTWGKIKIGWLYIPILNIPARRKALVLHDIHHILTEYSGDWKGEVSIGAWEVSSGCGKFWVAWVLDFMAMGIGLFIYPKQVFNAFILGRRTKNLYVNSITQESALSMKIEDLRDLLLLNQASGNKATIAEVLDFISYSVIALASFLLPYVLMVLFLFFILK